MNKSMFLIFILCLSGCKINALKLQENTDEVGSNSVSMIVSTPDIYKFIEEDLLSLGLSPVASPNNADYLLIVTHQCFFPIIIGPSRCTSQIDAVNRKNNQSVRWQDSEQRSFIGHNSPYVKSALAHSLNILRDKMFQESDKLKEIGFPVVLPINGKRETKDMYRVF